MAIDEIVLPETKPETEWVRGRARRIDVNDKTSVYLRSGLVIVVDPQRRASELLDAAGTNLIGEEGMLEHAALRGFSYSVGDLFAVLRRA